MQTDTGEEPLADAQPADEYSFYFEGSSDKGVLLIHGLTGAPAEMRFVGKMLNRLGFTVYAPVVAGHCQGRAALEAVRYEDWIESMREPLNRLKREVRYVYTAGICVGGAIGLMLAHLERGKVEKSVIYSPTMNYDGWNQTFWGKLGAYLIPRLIWCKPLHRLSFDERPPFGIKEERMRRFIVEGASMKGIQHSMPVIALYENCRLNQAMTAALPHMTVPTFLLHAAEDDVSNPRNAATIKRLHGGECHLQYLYNSYHMIHVDQERERVAQLTAEFFGLPETSKTATQREAA